MKKIILSLILLMSFMSLLFVNVSAYSEHYLPGGKNYISSDNLIKVDNIVSTITPFLVKPYTEYTLSISRDHIDGRPFYLNIYLYS
ncbi:MAG: hypothetical protein RBR66_04125, partial [Candidatus Izemoplasmatales bacterium]|nr:hypothetical protein [Candidatus Izemoplasmatales bacterium]